MDGLACQRLAFPKYKFIFGDKLAGPFVGSVVQPSCRWRVGLVGFVVQAAGTGGIWALVGAVCCAIAFFVYLYINYQKASKPDGLAENKRIEQVLSLRRLYRISEFSLFSVVTMRFRVCLFVARVASRWRPVVHIEYWLAAHLAFASLTNRWCPQQAVPLQCCFGRCSRCRVFCMFWVTCACLGKRSGCVEGGSGAWDSLASAGGAA